MAARIAVGMHRREIEEERRPLNYCRCMPTVWLTGQFPPLAASGRGSWSAGRRNTGKSTLARAIGGKLGLPVGPSRPAATTCRNTDWEQRPDDEFAALHDAAIAGERWVMDGNYSALIAAAAGAGDRRSSCSARTAGAASGRYFRRTLFETRRPRRPARGQQRQHQVGHDPLDPASCSPRSGALSRDPARAPGCRSSSSRRCGSCARSTATWELTQRAA